MEDWKKRIYGEDRLNKEEAFKTKLSEIENKHEDVFKNKPSKIWPDRPDKHNKLHDHYVIFDEGHIIRFGFNKDSDVPTYIQEECNAAFNEVYNNEGN